MSNNSFRRGTPEGSCRNGYCPPCYQAVCFRKNPVVEGKEEIHAAPCLKHEIEDLGRPLENYMKNGTSEREVKA